MLTIEHDDDGGCFRLLDDDVGLCTSKSRNVLVRLRDALNAVRATGLAGLTVESTKDTIPNRIDGQPRAVVLALSGTHLVVRKTDNMLDLWHVGECRVVEAAKPDKETPSNEPAIGVNGAVDLLLRWLEDTKLQEETGVDGREHKRLIADTRKFLAARKRAEPVP